MKIILFATWFSVYMSFAWGMNDETRENEGNWRGQLKPLCENYQRYLPNQYICVCTKFFHNLFNTNVVKDEKTKNDQLEEIISHIDEKNWDAQTMADFLSVRMSPFNDDFGKSFAICASKILEPYVEKWQECFICCDRDANLVYVPCGHLASCENCGRQVSSCPICKQIPTSVIEFKGTRPGSCFTCKQAKPKMLFVECQHLVLCEQCDAKQCPVCEEARDIIIKVFEG